MFARVWVADVLIVVTMLYDGRMGLNAVDALNERTRD